jgi:hypothetical protein
LGKKNGQQIEEAFWDWNPIWQNVFIQPKNLEEDDRITLVP